MSAVVEVISHGRNQESSIVGLVIDTWAEPISTGVAGTSPAIALARPTPARRSSPPIWSTERIVWKLAEISVPITQRAVVKMMNRTARVVTAMIEPNRPSSPNRL